MHRFMLDIDGVGTLFEGVWFTNGPVVICGGPENVRIFANMDELRTVYAPLMQLRWLDNMDEYWDERDFAVRSAHYDWTYQGLSYTLPAPSGRN